MHFNREYWTKLEKSGIGYDFFDGENLVVRKFDNGKYYVRILNKNKKELFFSQNKTTKKIIEEMDSLIQLKERELEILNDAKTKYKTLENVK